MVPESPALQADSLPAELPGKPINEAGGEIKSFTDKQKLKEFSTTKPALQEMLKGLP